MSLYIEVQDAVDALERATAAYRRSGNEAAKAEADYQSAKARRALQLKAEGNSAAMIALRIKGDPEVNGYLMQRECARALYEADRELINTIKLTIRVKEAQLEREYQG